MAIRLPVIREKSRVVTVDAASGFGLGRLRAATNAPLIQSQPKANRMVRINRVTTRGGDKGETSLGDGTRVRKDDPRIVAIGAVEEANAAIGLLRLMTRDNPEATAMLARIQNDLFDLGADLCVPGEAGDRLRLNDTPVLRLEAEVAAMNDHLPPLTSFILPGGSEGSTHAHVARSVVRRAERAVAGVEQVNPVLIRYMNRLSDHLFVLGRVLNENGAADVLWVPGANR
jgi:cob(I)alamin adenosyltransferase